MMELIRQVIRCWGRDDGQALAEYALVLAFIAIVCVVAVTALGLAISGSYTGFIGSL